MNIDVSIIIVNYNTFKITKECIESIFQKTKDIYFEIILVDNASIDESKSCFEKDDRIIYIYNNENLGFGSANNKGIEIAKGRNILFLNSDTLLINNAIKILSDFLDNNRNVGGCGGNMYDKNLKPSHSFGRFFPSILWEINLLSHNFLSKLLFGRNTEHNFSNYNMEISHIIGADLMVKRSVIEQVGGFNPVFFMYREETELCYRICKLGYKLYSVPTAKIIHLEGQSVKNNIINKQKIKWLQTSHNTFLEMYYSKNYIRICKLIYKITIKTRIIICHFFKKNKLEYWKTVDSVNKSI